MNKKRDMKAFFKNLNYRHYIAMSIILVLLILTGLNISSNLRFYDSLINIKNSIVYYFRCLITLDFDASNITITNIDHVFDGFAFPINFDAFVIKFRSFFKLFINLDHLKNFGQYLSNNLEVISRILLIGILPLFLIIFLIRIIFFKRNDKPAGYISKPLRIVKKINDVSFKKINAWIKDFIIFFFSYFYKTILIIIILYNLNLISFVVDFFAWYFYFIFSFDLISIYTLLLKLFIDISVLYHPIFIPLWIILFYYLILKARLKAAYLKLYKFLLKNEEFINGLGVTTGIYGPPGAGKNTIEVAMAIQNEKIMRDNCENDMFEIRLEFPDFPWAILEQEIIDLMIEGKVVNKIQIKHHFKEKFKDESIYYDYDISKKKSYHYDNLKNVSLLDEILDYAQLFYIYIGSLSISTYSINYDDCLIYDGLHHPIYDFDWLKRDYRYSEIRRSKNIDFNMFRMLKTIDTNNPHLAVLDSGIITLSEISKERGNAISNRDRKDDDVKPSNDGYAMTFKLIRHLGSVRHRCYIKTFWDDQRLGALSGDENNLAETNIYILANQPDFKLSIGLFFIESTILSWICDIFSNIVKKYITIRNDDNILISLIKYVASFSCNLKRNIFNAFAYKKMNVSLSNCSINGTQKNDDEMVYYIIPKIVYANRYRSSCYEGLFEKIKLKADYGINEMDEFAADVASAKEIQRQNSYWGRDLIMAISEKLSKNDSEASPPGAAEK